MKEIRTRHPCLRAGLIVGGPDRQPPERYKGDNHGKVKWLHGPREGDRTLSQSAQFLQEAKEGVEEFARLVRSFKEAEPTLCWHAMLDDGASMNTDSRRELTEILSQAYGSTPIYFDAVHVGHVACPRLYWPSFPIRREDMAIRGLGLKQRAKDGLMEVIPSGMITSSDDGVPVRSKLKVEQFLDKGCEKKSLGPFPNATRRRQLAKTPSEEQVERKKHDEMTLRRWEDSQWPLSPVHYKPENCVIDRGKLRPPNANESERMRGFRAGYTEGASEAPLSDEYRIGLIGSSISCIVLAQLLGSWG